LHEVEEIDEAADDNDVGYVDFHVYVIGLAEVFFIGIKVYERLRNRDKKKALS